MREKMATTRKKEKKEGIHLTAQMYSSRQMGLTILNRLGVREAEAAFGHTQTASGGQAARRAGAAGETGP